MKFGICYRPYMHSKYIQDICKELSIIEIMPDIMSVKENKKIKTLSEQFNIDVGLHSLKASLASPEGPQIKNIENYYYLNNYLSAKYYSDHIAISHYKDKYLSSVIPIDYTDHNIKIMKNNIDSIKHMFFNNLHIENITQKRLSINSEMTESSFINKMTNINSTKSLFDITNMYITAQNNNIEFNKYIVDYPFDKVEIMHVSGFSIDIFGNYQDTHDSALNTEILDAIQLIKKKLINIKYILIERDFNILTKKDIILDLNKLKEIFNT